MLKALNAPLDPSLDGTNVAPVQISNKLNNEEVTKEDLAEKGNKGLLEEMTINPTVTSSEWGWCNV